MKRLRIKTAVYAVFEKRGKILFLRRYKTKYGNGLYTLPSGHIERGENPRHAVIREIGEEIGLSIRERDLEFVHVVYEKDTYIDFYFKVTAWKGEPYLKEKDKSDDLKWIKINNIRNQVVSKVRKTLYNYKRRKFFSEIEKTD